MKLEKFFIPSNESDVRLEIVAAMPQHQGPYPAIIFNHGSTGRGHNKALYKETISPAIIAKYFTERGWLTLFPQRRGRGKSGGSYGEGLASDGSGYSCNVELTIAGFERAVEDVDAVVRHLRNAPTWITISLSSEEFLAGAFCLLHTQVCAQVFFGALSILTADGLVEVAQAMKSSIQAFSYVAHLPAFRRFGCTEAMTNTIG